MALIGNWVTPSFPPNKSVQEKIYTEVPRRARCLQGGDENEKTQDCRGVFTPEGESVGQFISLFYRSSFYSKTGFYLI